MTTRPITHARIREAKTPRPKWYYRELRKTCKHPPARLYSFHTSNGLFVGCCRCGTILK